jgi:hypothetical protein
MDKQKEGIKIRHGIKIWILFLALLIYSFQSIMDIEELSNPLVKNLRAY